MLNRMFEKAFLYERQGRINKAIGLYRTCLLAQDNFLFIKVAKRLYELDDILRWNKWSQHGFRLPEEYYINSYWAAFITLKCNFRCSFCIQPRKSSWFRDEIKTNFRLVQNIKDISGKDIIDFWNNLAHPLNWPLSVIGGEPSIHPDFMEIINGLDGYFITVTTNLATDIFENINKLDELLDTRCSIRFNTSFHPMQIKFDQFITRFKALQDAGFILGQIAMVDYPGADYLKYKALFEENGLNLDAQTFTGWYNNKFYPHENNAIEGLTNIKDGTKKHGTGIDNYELFREGFAQTDRKSVMCKTERLLMGPDGKLYDCHAHLYGGTGSMGTIYHLEKTKFHDGYFKCSDFGCCNPCDYPNVKFKSVHGIEYKSKKF